MNTIYKTNFKLVDCLTNLKICCYMLSFLSDQPTVQCSENSIANRYKK